MEKLPVTTEPRTIRVAAGSELDELVNAANEASVILEKDGVRYRVTRENDDLWARYDPEAVVAALHAARGTLTPEEGDELKASMYREREEGSRPADRP
jgi:hypothetical protein